MVLILALLLWNPALWTTFKDFRYVNSIVASPRYIYIATEKGIARYDKLKELWEVPPTKTPFPEKIGVIGFDSYTGELWFTTPGYLNRYNPIFEDFKSFSIPSGISTIDSIGISKDFICVAKLTNIKFDKLMEEWKSFDSLPKDIRWFPSGYPEDYTLLAPYYIYVPDELQTQYSMTCVAEDGQDLWVGTAGYGVYKYNMINLEVKHYLFGIFCELVNAIYKEGSTVWFAGTGITEWDKDSGNWQYFSPTKDLGLLSDNISSVASNDRFVFFGTDEGLSIYDKSDGTWRTYRTSEGLPSNEITSLYVSEDTLWIGTHRGIAKLVNDKIVEVPSEFRMVHINDIAAASQYLLVATSAGVYTMDKNGLLQIKDPDGLLDFGVTKILVDDTAVYFGTKMGVVVHNKGEWKRFKYPAELPSNNILAFASDSSNLWIGTDAGVARFDKITKVWLIYDRINSPISGSVYAILIDNPHIYFGTKEGVIRFYFK